LLFENAQKSSFIFMKEKSNSRLIKEVLFDSIPRINSELVHFAKRCVCVCEIMGQID